MKAAAVAILTVGVLVACRDQQSVTAVKPPLSADFSDGRSTGGNPHFFFLPPLVAQPTFSGVFNPQIQPVVDICQLNTSVTPHVCDTRPGAPADIILGPVLDATGQTYHVNWDTSQPAISTTQFYRIQVLGSPGSTCSAPPKVPCLGFADMDPVANGSQLKNVNTGEYIGLVDGRTLPIKFRIEQGAFLSDFNCTDCVEATVTNNGATVVTNTGFAGAQFPAGWLQGTNPTPVVVTIERVTTIDGVTINDAGSVRCIPLALGAAPEQFEGCYRFTTLPLATFAKFVTVGICIPVTTLSETDLDAIQLYSVEEGEEGTFGVKALPNVPAPFVSCAGFTSTPVSTGLLRGLPGQLVQHLARLVTPKSAYAFHLGAGGSTCCFSRIGWVLPASTLINFDVGPGGTTTIEAGEIVNTAYMNDEVINDETVGVTFGRTMTTGLCEGVNVYANDYGPLSGGGFGSPSGNNVVSICGEGTPSDFSENAGGRIVATFTGTVPQACIQVWATGIPSESGRLPGATGFLEAFDGGGLSIGKTTSDPNASGQTLCVNATATATIRSVQFAGSGDGFAMFDNMTVRFAQAPPPILPGLE